MSKSFPAMLSVNAIKKQLNMLPEMIIIIIIIIYKMTLIHDDIQYKYYTGIFKP